MAGEETCLGGKGFLRVMGFDPEGYNGDEGSKKDEYN